MDGTMSTPLRCNRSRAAGKPFRSPIITSKATVVTCNGQENETRSDDRSSCLVDERARSGPTGEHYSRTTSPGLGTYPRAVTLKRTCSHKQRLIKKICSEENPDVDSGSNSGEPSRQGNLSALRERVRMKQQQVEHLRKQLILKNKHKSCDLSSLTERWLCGCQKALKRLHKDLQERGDYVSMSDVLSQLSIPQDLVRYSPDGGFT